MKLQETHISYGEMIRADISKEEREKANKLAKSKGYSFKGWVGQLIKAELKSAEVSDGTRN